MLIAVATDDGKHIAAHFGRCGFFSIWQCMEGEEPNHLGLRPNTFTAHAAGGGTAIPNEMLAPPPGEVPGEQAIAPAQGDLERATHSHVLEGLADVQVVISAGMGWRMVNDFKSSNREVFVTNVPEVAGAVGQYIAGKLESGEPCEGK